MLVVMLVVVVVAVLIVVIVERREGLLERGLLLREKEGFGCGRVSPV